ncbi:MAG: LssY C-terminal domain-containing protein [Mesorhizobium sp.]
MGVPIEPLPIRRRKTLRTLSAGLALLTVIYLLAAYLLLPGLWTWFYDDHPVDAGMLTTTPQGIPGDPINVGLVGSREEILHAFAEAGWDPADAITIKSSVEIGLSVVLDRPDLDAPVSTLLYEGRRQDLAFEKPVGSSADKRNHLRLWQTETLSDGRPLWLGSASFDRGVGVSHDTGQITHHIGPDVDAERNLVIADLKKIGSVTTTYELLGRGPTEDGRNGGGDRYFTDGMVLVGVLKP